MEPILLQATTAAPTVLDPGITQVQALAQNLSIAGILLMVLIVLYRAYQQKEALVAEKDKQILQLLQQMAQMQADSIRTTEQFQATVARNTEVLSQNTALMQKMYEKQL
ncbi:hypothetical protein GCM10028806_34170 [Spirosoma terrae]|uniref:Uncharacterized protein n=1 Tax=Spirosoma terrae TaxID=1968276 RepID=A0A6L9L5Q2_9BACT|nr:hypothetical protein [Spirosoma terrae]NDU95730.1 hypothetical protein [Spirosoma terrae]